MWASPSTLSTMVRAASVPKTKTMSREERSRQRRHCSSVRIARMTTAPSVNHSMKVWSVMQGRDGHHKPPHFFLKADTGPSCPASSNHPEVENDEETGGV